MALRYLAAVALTLALALPVSAAARRAAGHAQQPPGQASIDLYSQRALRRAKIILELKLLELKKERLERVRKAIEQHIPVDQLLKE